MKIAIAGLGDPGTVRAWSGIPYNITMALRKRGHEIIPIPLSRPPEPWHYKWLRRYYVRVHRKWFLSDVEQESLERISHRLDSAVNDIAPDVVLVVHGDWLAYATFDYPACIIHDTTFASILDYYPSFTNLTARSIMMGHRMYQRALDKAKAAVFSAEWASRSALLDYGSPQSKVFTIPFGANIDPAPAADDVAQWIDARCEREVCNLLFMGTQWERKGGPETLRFVEKLNRSGIRTVLTVVGCTPSVPALMRANVRELGYLKKECAEDNEVLEKILREAHALILPSHAECFGCVYCEANAYGLPALGRDTGGVPEIIKDGVNGLLLGADESVDSFAERWARVWTDRMAYKEMSRRSYTEFTRRLNYDAFASKLEEVLMPLVQNRKELSYVA